MKITGPAQAPVLVRILLSQAHASRLHLKSRVLGSVTRAIGADGTTSVGVPVASKSRRAPARAPRQAISVDAICGDRHANIAASA